MPNGSDYANVNGDLALLIQEKAAELTSTLYQNFPLPAALGFLSNNKPDALWGIGTPGSDTIIGGAKIPAAHVRSMMQSGSYSPLQESILQSDVQRVAWRAPTTIPSAHSGTAPTITLTIVNGSVTAASSSGGTGFTGAYPTIEVEDAVGHCGHSAQLEVTSFVADGSGGTTIGTIAVRSGGYNYSTGAGVIVSAGMTLAERIGRPTFKFSMVENVMQIHQDDIDATKFMVQYSSNEIKSGAALDLVNGSIKDAVAAQGRLMHADFISGVPTSEAATRWDQPYGALAGIDDSTFTSNYATIDRTAAGTGWYRSAVESTPMSMTFQQTVDYVQLKMGLAYNGTVPTLYVVDPMVMLKWKGEMTNLTQEVNLAEQGELRKMAQYGFRLPALRYGDSYAISDQKLPQGTCLAINPLSVAIAFRTGMKLQPTEMFDQQALSGGIRGKKFFVRTQWMPMWLAPKLNAKLVSLAA